MPLLTTDDILAARKARLLAAATPPVSSAVAVSFGVPTPQLTAIATPPPKKIFSILSWNIKDYKGSKIVAEKKGKQDNPFINQFVKVVSEVLQTDLMMIIETDVDLTEAVARIEDERDDLFGHQVTSPSTPVPVMDDPGEDLTRARDDNFYADVKKRTEALASGPDSKYTAVGSDMAYRKVNLPPKFTLADLQKDYYKHPNGPLSEDGLPWWTYLEGVGRCYDVQDKGVAVDIAQLLMDFPTKPASALDAKVEFLLKSACDECGGSGALATTLTCPLCQGHGKPMDFHCRACGATGKLRGSVPCSLCKGAKVATSLCVCGGKGACASCAGNGRQVCGLCHGPRMVPCPQCHGSTGMSDVICSYCLGKGQGLVTPTCFACYSRGFIGCGTCKGSGRCGNCGGTGTVNSNCSGCNGVGAVGAVVNCGSCAGLGHNPSYVCQHCKGARFSVCPACTGPGCKVCGGAGKLDCVPCGASGLAADAVCSRCNGDPHSIPCEACAATGLYDPEAEEHALQILRTLLTPSVFSNIDVETYTLLWRNPSKQLPPTVMGSYYQACDNKAVWLDVGRAALCSKNELGVELGYQDPKKTFNSRRPFVVPLVLDVNGKKRQLVPLVLFHAIWGEVTGLKAPAKTELVKSRADSIYQLSKLGVPTPENGLKAVNQADGSILVGDFNIDYNGGKASRDRYNQDIKRYAKKVFDDLLADGYQAPVGGTQTGLTTRTEGIDRLQAGNGKDIHTYGYDNFLIKGADLQASIVNCGVYDILGLIETLLAKDAALVAWIDRDYINAPPPKPKTPRKPKAGKAPPKPRPVKTRKPFTDNRVRAFYLYYEYISDHLPIILDLLVDEIDPQYKTWLQEQEAFIQKPIEKPPLRTLGNWTALGPTTNPASVVATSTTARICGLAKVVCFPDLIGVWIEPDLLFYGACQGLNPSALLGQQVQGDFVLGERTYLDKSDYVGKWIGKLTAAKEKNYFVQRVDDKKLAVRGRVKWFDTDGNVAVACWMLINSARVKRVYQGTGEFVTRPAVGDWVECIFEPKA